jgi:hypothetical protein
MAGPRETAWGQPRRSLDVKTPACASVSRVKPDAGKQHAPVPFSPCPHPMAAADLTLVVSEQLQPAFDGSRPSRVG